MQATLERAALADVTSIAALRVAVAAKLTYDFGKGPWSSGGTWKRVSCIQCAIQTYLSAGRREKIIGVLELGIKKPWAIATSLCHFTVCNRPLYLAGMAVAPGTSAPRHWPRDAGSRTDDCSQMACRTLSCLLTAHFHAAAGAGEFYAKCDFQEMGRITYRNAPPIYYEQLLPPLDSACHRRT